MTQPTPPPAVPYGPSSGATAAARPPGSSLTLSKASVGGTAGKWAIRLLLPIIIRAIFRAIFR